MASHSVTIHFEGKALTCRSDATVAVALWENGIRHLSNSPKYGRKRGLTCARGHCTACLMRVDGEPNIRTCERPVRDGMVVERQDAGAFYAAPMQAILGSAGALFPVGFYYKWFTKPKAVSKLFLDQIRPLTGVGRIPDSVPKAGHLISPRDLGRWDTVVVGAGPAGLAAVAALDEPALVIDENDAPGGQRWAALKAIAATEAGKLQRLPVLAAAHKRLAATVQNFASGDLHNFQGRTRVIAGYYPDGLLLRQGDQLATVNFNKLVWAGGALDTLGLFPGNDTPGLLGPRALYRLLTRDNLDVTGKRALVIGSGLDLWLSAALLAARGAYISLVVTESGWQSEVSAAVDFKWQLTTGLDLANIRPHGSAGLEATFLPGQDTPGPAHSHLRLETDLAVICGRGKPVYDVPCQLGAKVIQQPDLGGFLPEGTLAGHYEGDLPGGRRLVLTGEAAGTLPENQAEPSREGTPS